MTCSGSIPLAGTGIVEKNRRAGKIGPDWLSNGKIRGSLLRGGCISPLFPGEERDGCQDHNAAHDDRKIERLIEIEPHNFPDRPPSNDDSCRC